jgi:hypothetical protein
MSDAAPGDFFLLTDPEWESDGGEPPIEAIIGLWPVDDKGMVGRFTPNPDYRPKYENSPSDPVDALLRLAMRGDAPMEQLQLILRDSMFDLALNGDGRPLIVRSPDDVMCVVITTSAPHRDRVMSPVWQQSDLMDLAQRLADGVDVFINPNGPAAVRLTGSFIRETVLMTDDDVAAAYAEIQAQAARD